MGMTLPAARSMSQATKFDFLDLGGSINEGAPGRSLAPNEWRSLVNWYQQGTRLIRRGGVTAETEEAPQQLTGTFVLHGATERNLLALGIDTLYRQDGTDLEAIPRVEGGVFPSTTLPWSVTQYTNLAYLTRRDNLGLRRAGADFVQQAGIEQMSPAPVIADGGAGVMTAGDYTVVVTGYNSLTNGEGNPSDQSNTLTLGASKKISGTVGVHPNPQVDKKRIYVTVPSQPGRWFFAAEIENGTTTFEINLAIQDYGDDASFSNGMPPPRLEAHDVWRERMFATDGIDLFYSQIAKMEQWDENDFIPIERNNGHRITAIHATGDESGGRLYVGKTKGIHFLVSSEGGFARRTLSEKHGCWSHHSMKSAEGSLFWYGGDNIYRSDNGGPPYSISTIPMRNLLRSIPKTKRDYVTGFVYPKLSWYALTIPTTEFDTMRYLLVYNYKTNVWATFEYLGANAPNFVLADFDEDDEPALYATFNGDTRVLKLESGPDDIGDSFVCAALSGDHDFGGTGFIKFVQAIHLLTAQRPSFTRPGQSFRLGIALDGSSTPDHQRIVTLDTARPWKRFNYSTTGKPSVTAALYINYEGYEHVELDAYSLEMLVQARYPVSR